MNKDRSVSTTDKLSLFTFSLVMLFEFGAFLCLYYHSFSKQDIDIMR